MAGASTRYGPLSRGPSLYPIDLTSAACDVSGNPRLELCRQGLDEDVVALKGTPGKAPPSR